MSRNVRVILGIIVVVALIAAGVYAYIYVSGGDGTPTGETIAPTLAIATSAPITDEPPAATDQPDSEMTAEPISDTGADATSEADAETASQPTAGELVVFNIVSDQSTVSFTLTEDLMGRPTTVVGTTDQVAGQLAVDFANPSASQVGEIRINARTLQTDQENRNRAIRGQILQSAQDEFEFISFVPTSVEGLPAAVTMGEPFEFTITGDLTIRDITQSVTFETTVTPVSETQLEGTATTTVMRGDYNLTIPNVPSVANVSEEVQLEIEFVAAAA
jgi:polyisoprenoid-binding protein YceI